MTKRDFIQHYVLRWFNRCRTHEPRLSTLIREGESLWSLMEKRGYGARQERGPREHLDWYGSLSEQQRACFNRFWTAFAYKQGRNEAAMRWSQINPDAHTAEHIIHAATLEAENRKKRPEGQTPIMAQGWLNARRWEDYPRPPRWPTHFTDEAIETNRRAEQSRLRAEILHLDKMIKRQPDSPVTQQLRDQADELRGRLAVLEAEADV